MSLIIDGILTQSYRGDWSCWAFYLDHIGNLRHRIANHSRWESLLSEADLAGGLSTASAPKPADQIVFGEQTTPTANGSDAMPEISNVIEIKCQQDQSTVLLR